MSVHAENGLVNIVPYDENQFPLGDSGKFKSKEDALKAFSSAFSYWPIGLPSHKTANFIQNLRSSGYRDVTIMEFIEMTLD